MPKGNYRGRDIPWLKVVQFHKDVVARAESGFFSLKGKDDQSARWSSLHNFNPEDMAGPWTIETNNIHSKSFLSAYEQGNHESVFIGGPGYLGFEKPFGSNNWVANWRPLLYKEVELTKKGQSFIVTPKSGSWSVTPLLYELLDRLEVSLDQSIDDVASKLIEKAAGLKSLEDISLEQSLIQAFSRAIPALEETLFRKPKTGDFNVNPTPWVLFAPVDKYSAIIRHLMSDYEKLESKLISNPKEIGGLKLLEDNSGKIKKNKTRPLPLVPLNSQQESAVQSILAGNPLTVISGPPGTGKSQVVVSLLLNAWAQGKSVLFASNNNKAVDVVRKRVEHFESEFPIAVRAGSRAKQNINEVLRRTLNMAEQGNGSNSNNNIKNSQEKLIKERNKLQESLDTKVPQRIDEARKTAFDAYGNYQRILADIAAKEEFLQSKKRELRLGNLKLLTIEERLKNTNDWLSSIHEVETKIKEDCADHKKLLFDIKVSEQNRNQLASLVGLSSEKGGDWSWLINGPSPETLSAWISQTTSIFEQPIENKLTEFKWDTRFDQWKSSKKAKQWHLEANSYVKKSREFIETVKPKLEFIELINNQISSLRKELEKSNIPEDTQIPIQTIEAWNSIFAESVATTPKLFDWIPWSAKKKNNRLLLKIEKGLRTKLPVSTWVSLGVIDNSSRNKLADLLKMIHNWQKLNIEWKDAQPTINELKKLFSSMTSNATSLRLSDIPNNYEIKEWERLADKCNVIVGVSESAISAWNHKEEKQKTETVLTSVANQFHNIASGLPLRDAWNNSSGENINTAFSEMQQSPTIHSLKNCRNLLYTGAVQKFYKSWNNCLELQNSIEEKLEEISCIPTSESRKLNWIDQQPSESYGTSPSVDEWPLFNSVKSDIEKIQTWFDNSISFQNDELPEKTSESVKELEWAVNRLADVKSNIPNIGSKKLDEICDLIFNDPKTEWPLDLLNDELTKFSPDRIRAKINQLNAKIEQHSFENAKSKWIERLREDEESIKAVHLLERLLSKKKINSEEEHENAFRNTLRLVPIWITTAQAAQSIPLSHSLFDIVVIDEASQCTLTNLLPLMYRGKSLAVIGDEQQLPAIAHISESEQTAIAIKHGVEDQMLILGHVGNDVYKTATESLPRRRADVINLLEHFRSHPQIIGFSNRHIYQQKLELKKDPQWGKRLPIGSGVHSIQVNGIVTRGPNGRSWKNEVEAEKVIQLISRFREGDTRNLEIGVVTPFAPHKQLLRDMLDKASLSKQVFVDTAYGFQGDERDVIIFSPVVSKGITEMASRWVESPPNQINVALTRAREVLFVVGDLDYCRQQDGILHHLALYCSDIELLRKTSEAELELFSWMIVKGWIPEVHPKIGDIEVDFSLKTHVGDTLVIEVDGKTHQQSKEQDKARDIYLRGQGCIILRFSGRAVLKTPFEVISKIEEEMQGTT